jgi:acetyl/propionyl-CoA carboxylase alpha subunit
MFAKILVANRGEIAVRIIRSIRDLGLQSVSIFDPNDLQSLHVRFADECFAIQSEMDRATDVEIIELAKRVGADAIHPGYGFLAEKADFARKCAEAGLVLIGSTPDILFLLQDRLAVLDIVKKAGIPTPSYLPRRYQVGQVEKIIPTCLELGFPLIFQACLHQAGRSIWFIESESQAVEMLDRLKQKQPGLEIFLEEHLHPVHLLRVPVLGMENSTPIVFNEIDSSIQYRNRRLIEESPSPVITPEIRREIRQMTHAVTRCLGFTGLGTIDYLVQENGAIVFSKIKPYVPASHLLNEVITGFDLVALQIKQSFGLEPGITQEDIHTSDHGLLCRISAVDPFKNFLPSPGVIRNFRLPAGPFVRCDSHITQGYQIPEKYDPILVKIATTAKERSTLLSRMCRALLEITISGITTDLPVLLYLLDQPEFTEGLYHTDFVKQKLEGQVDTVQPGASNEEYLNFAIATASAYYQQRKLFRPVMPERLKTSWHQDSRKP